MGKVVLISVNVLVNTSTVTVQRPPPERLNPLPVYTPGCVCERRSVSAPCGMDADPNARVTCCALVSGLPSLSMMDTVNWFSPTWFGVTENDILSPETTCVLCTGPGLFCPVGKFVNSDVATNTATLAMNSMTMKVRRDDVTRALRSL